MDRKNKLEVTSTEKGWAGGGNTGVGGTNCWVEDRFKDVLYNTGNIDTIL